MGGDFGAILWKKAWAIYIYSTGYFSEIGTFFKNGHSYSWNQFIVSYIA